MSSSNCTSLTPSCSTREVKTPWTEVSVCSLATLAVAWKPHLIRLDSAPASSGGVVGHERKYREVMTAGEDVVEWKKRCHRSETQLHMANFKRSAPRARVLFQVFASTCQILLEPRCHPVHVTLLRLLPQMLLLHHCVPVRKVSDPGPASSHARPRHSRRGEARMDSSEQYDFCSPDPLLPRPPSIPFRAAVARCLT